MISKMNFESEWRRCGADMKKTERLYVMYCSFGNCSSVRCVREFSRQSGADVALT